MPDPYNAGGMPSVHPSAAYHLFDVGCVQVTKDFLPVLQRLSKEERLTLLNLVSADGMIIEHPHTPLALLLEPFLTRTEDAAGRTVIRLFVPWHAPLIQVSACVPTHMRHSEMCRFACRHRMNPVFCHLQRLIDEDVTLKSFSIIERDTWLPLAYTSACLALTAFGEEVNVALRAKPCAADVDATFKVRCCLCCREAFMASQASILPCGHNVAMHTCG